jgi:RND family efflux transporter MFP subunit
MSTSRRIVGAVLLLALGVGAGFGADRLWFAHSAGAAPAPSSKPAPGDEEDEPEPAAVVRTALAEQGQLPRVVDAIGAAAIPPSATLIESWPTDVLVVRILVQPGERVTKDAPLAQIKPTREIETQLAAGQLALESAGRALDLVQQRLDRGLATRTDLLTAQSSRDEVLQKLDRLRASLPPEDGQVKAHAAGTVGAVRVQPGATVSAGSPMVEVTLDAIVAQVGLDPAEAPSVAVGQAFEVRPVDERAAGRWTGTVSLLAGAVNPTTRLVDATLTLSGDAAPRAGTPLRARASLAGATGILIPRAALVPDGDAMVIFVVRDGTAVRTPVTVNQSGRERVVVAGAVGAGDHVVVSGQGQLTPGATVREIAPGKDTTPAKDSGGAGADR